MFSARNAPSMNTTGPMRQANSPRFATQRQLALLLSITAGLTACSGQKPADEVAQQPAVAATPAAGRSNGGAIASEAEDGQWTRPAKSFSSTRFSGLTEITADNVKNLHLAWTFGTGILRGHEDAPL